MEDDLQSINVVGAAILQMNSDTASNIPVTAVKLVPNDYYEATDNMNANVTKTFGNINKLGSKVISIEEIESDPINEEDESILIDEHPPPSEAAINSIMDVCSTAAQHIRQTITDVLNSRKEEESAASATSCDSPSMLEASLKEKLANFEQTCMLNNLPKSVTPHLSTTETNVKGLEDLSVSETEIVEPALISECTVLVDKNSNEESGALDANGTRIVNVNRHPSCGESSDSQSSDISITNKTSVSSENTEKTHKKSQKNMSNKKKGEKTIDHILKSLSNYSTAEEKLQALCRKHSETLEDFKSGEIRLKLNERQITQLAREKEQLQAEHNRMVLAKSRLESLCRELQRQNKAVKEESLLRIREEEEKRKDVASKFQTTLNEITTLMQEHSKKNLQLKDENSELAKKLKSLVEHYEMWEKHMEKVLHQKDLESQLAKAKQAKTNLQLKQDTEKFLREKQALLENLSDLQARCTQLASNELQLRGELADYTSKYEEFQTVLSKSNQVFATFKADMDTTSKKIKKLEKETNIWKQKWENSNKSLLDMITDKQKRDKELLVAQQRVLTLEKLCRALQAERNDLQSQINGTAQTVELSQPQWLEISHNNHANAVELP